MVPGKCFTDTNRILEEDEAGGDKQEKEEDCMYWTSS